MQNMSYKYSQIDKDNLNWFPKDDTKATLLTIKLDDGHIRGLYDFELEFKYPISVIAGKNGSGKSTILALAACAFHNAKDGFEFPGRNNTYYTFSNFFIQSNEEIPPDGISIKYKILHNNWRNTPNGPGWQIRKKKIKGKWNKYSSRVKRNVVFFGIDRVVPHSEKSVSKSYCRYFTESEKKGWENEVKSLVGKILNRNYDDFWHKKAPFGCKLIVAMAKHRMFPVK
jgi:predicted ATP-dependent endonuclease of OLD family